jgi:O-antigen/teichoic acid export membrane protein
VKICDNYFFSLMTLGGATLMQMMVVLIIARELGAADFGRYSVYASALAISIEVCGLGGGDFFVRHGERGELTIQELAGYCLTYGLLSAIVLTPLMILAIAFFGVAATSPLLFFFVFLDLLFSRYAIFIEYFYIGLGRAENANLLRLFINLSKVVAAGTYFFLVGREATLTGWIFIQASISALGGIVVLVVYVANWRVTVPFIQMSLMAESFPFGVTQLLRVTQANFDRLLLGLILPMDILGAYSAASRFTTASLTPVLVLLRGTVAGFYEAAARGRSDVGLYAFAVARKAFTVTLATTILLVVGLYFVEIIIGAEYKNVLLVGCALIPSLFVTVALYVCGDYFNAMGFSVIRMYVTMIGIAIYVALAYLLGTTWGIWGVIVAINLSAVCNLTIFVSYYLAWVRGAS